MAERALSAVRIGTAALAIAVALSLLFRIPLIATFRGALVVLAAGEVLVAGRRALGAAPMPWSAWAEVLVKLGILAAAYVALGSG